MKCPWGLFLLLLPWRTPPHGLSKVIDRAYGHHMPSRMPCRGLLAHWLLPTWYWSKGHQLVETQLLYCVMFGGPTCGQSANKNAVSPGC